MSTLPQILNECTSVGPGSFVGVDNCNIAPNDDSVVVGGLNNTTFSNLAVVGGGNGNTIWSGDYSFIGGGYSNQLSGFQSAAQGFASVLAGGWQNSIFSSYSSILGGQGNDIGDGFPPYPNADYSVVVGGYANSIRSGASAAIVGGQLNRSEATNDFIGGGYGNRITVTGAASSNGGGDAVIDGGANNTIASTSGNAGYWAAIGGGTHNTVTGVAATVPGGVNNTAGGTASFAAGSNSYAKHDGSFVFGDDSANTKQLVTLGANEFLVRASGGVGFYSNAALTAGVKLMPGSGSWSSLSDRASKTNIVALDSAQVLEKVENLPISEWSYRAQSQSIRHVGPMAQDFYAAFGFGEDNLHITTIDEDGIALAAIKGLAAEVKQKSAELADLKKIAAQLASRDAKLEADVAALAAR